jgi:hypothetical protein
MSCSRYSHRNPALDDAHLATEVVEDPEPWEPTDDELAAIEAELIDAVEAMLAERTFTGVDDAVCGRSAYPSIWHESPRRVSGADRWSTCRRATGEPVLSRPGPVPSIR